MKNLKILLASLLMVFLFSSNAFAQKEKISERYSWGTETVPFCFWCPCAGDLDEEGIAKGEDLCGVVTFHVVKNKNIEHWNVKGGKLTGSETGRIYNFVRTDNVKLKTGELSLNVRTIGENGLTTFWQIKGRLEDEIFYCR